MIKHTPGPWSKIQGIDHTAASIRTDSGISVATVFGSDFDQTKANAHLIAAAPELLGALQSTLDHLVAVQGHNEGGIQIHIRSAIAKATGESK